MKTFLARWLALLAWQFDDLANRLDTDEASQVTLEKYDTLVRKDREECDEGCCPDCCSQEEVD